MKRRHHAARIEAHQFSGANVRHDTRLYHAVQGADTPAQLGRHLLPGRQQFTVASVPLAVRRVPSV